MKTFQIVLGLILVVALCSFAEEEEEEGLSPVGTTNTKNGILVFSNMENDFFTFEIRGKNSNAFKKSGHCFINVNGKGVQYNVVSFSDFLSPEEIKNKNDSAVLQKHLKFELKYIEDNFKTHLEVKMENKKCKNGRLILIWSFKMPKQAENVKMQLFMTTVTRNHVLVLNGIILKDKDYNEFYKILENAMNSIQLKETAIIPEALQDLLKKEK